MSQHLPTLRTFPYFSTPLVHVITCSCGEYTTGKCVKISDAQRAFRMHARAKGETP